MPSLCAASGLALGVLGLITGAAAAQLPDLATRTVASGFDRPVLVTYAPGEPELLFVLEQTGRVEIVSRRGVRLGTFLDLSGVIFGGNQGETGLLGIAFAPDYATSGRFFVNYTGTPDGQLESVVEEYRRDPGDRLRANPASAPRTIITIDQPFANHNGGWMSFGPDGLLYIAVGDGGSGNDPGDRASRLTTLQGKILRIDVADDTIPYAVPENNPFVDDPLNPDALEEIWAYGLRNPWRNAFDRSTGDLWIADVGQDAREEINFQPAGSPGGEHYGWRCREGDVANTAVGGCPAEDPLWVEPVETYGHGAGVRCSITGGYPSRGCTLGAEFDGFYFFGDFFCSGQIWALDPVTFARELVATAPPFTLTSFGEDAAGDLYTATLDGVVRRLVDPNRPGLVDVNSDSVDDRCLCPAEFTADGVLDHGDIAAFVGAFLAGDNAADLNGDGIVDNGDAQAFLALFLGGCAGS